MTFVSEHPIRFAECDPAGMVFFPRFLEMRNAPARGIPQGLPPEPKPVRFMERHRADDRKAA